MNEKLGVTVMMIWLKLLLFVAGDALYVSFAQYDNLLQYSLAGDLLSTSVLSNPSTTAGHKLHSLRGMAITSSGRLLVLNAHASESAVYLYSSCKASIHGSRTFLRALVSRKDDPALEHPYGVATTPQGAIFITNQA